MVVPVPGSAVWQQHSSGTPWASCWCLTSPASRASSTSETGWVRPHSVSSLHAVASDLWHFAFCFNSYALVSQLNKVIARKIPTSKLKFERAKFVFDNICFPYKLPTLPILAPLWCHKGSDTSLCTFLECTQDFWRLYHDMCNLE